MTDATPPATPPPAPNLWTPKNIVILTLAVVGVLVTIAALLLRQPEEADSRMIELGRQWAQGYAVALSANNPDQNVNNSLYGACIVYIDARIVPQYGQEAAADWLSGCLAYTREQQASPVPITSSSPTS